MPSQTIHLPEDLYLYILETKADQTTSSRAKELIEKGKSTEQTND